MVDLPKDLQEANVRVVAYYDKLIEKGYSKGKALDTAIGAWSKIKHHYKDDLGSVVGNCLYCKKPILHLLEVYAVSATDASETFMWHLRCFDG